MATVIVPSKVAAEIRTLPLKNHRMVMVPEEEHNRLLTEVSRLRRAMQRLKRLVEEEDDHDLPSMPKLDDLGCYPALEAIRVGLARTIIQRRKAAGWTQEKLARAAGL